MRGDNGEYKRGGVDYGSNDVEDNMPGSQTDCKSHDGHGQARNQSAWRGDRGRAGRGGDADREAIQIVED